jgi:phosphate transport system substrate-binding protein
MKPKGKTVVILVSLAMVVCLSILLASPCRAQEGLRISSSAQAYDAYLKEAVPAFEERSGAKVDVFVSSSSSSLGRLMSGLCDLAVTVEGFKFRYGEYGYLEIPFCKDPLIVITHPTLHIDSLTEEQVQGIFSGAVKKWKEVGGPNERIILVVPGETSAAYKNFDRQAMKGRRIHYDFMSYLSTTAVKAVQRVPFTISFIGQGAVAGQTDLKTLKISGKAPDHPDYPYRQVFSFAVEGNPAGMSKAFIDFTFSEEGQAVIKEKNMIPIAFP